MKERSFYLNEVKRIARDASQIIMNIYLNESQWNVVEKADLSPLTIADQKSNDFICRELNLLDPSIPIISEENKEIPYEQRKDFDLFWLVDPLDGTKEFIKRNGEFTVNIALIQGGYPVLGVIVVPATGVLYFAEEGKGAYKIEGGNLLTISCKTFHLDDSHLKIVASRSHLSVETSHYINRFHEAEIVSKGSSLKFMMLAEGAADLYPRLSPIMEWDSAAAQIILEEAGGSIRIFETGERMYYNKISLVQPSFIAAANCLP